jgi:predicted CDP-diglyceride synthetase/phosphatidate cytidylyltransferase
MAKCGTELSEPSGSTFKGNGGILDRIASLNFAAPVLLHLVRHFFVP